MSIPPTLRTGSKASKIATQHPAATESTRPAAPSRRRTAKEALQAAQTPRAPQETAIVSAAAGTDSDAMDDSATDVAAVRFQWIAVSAYFRAEQRGFADGSPDDDWLQAEREVDLMLAMREAAGLAPSS
jgi:hypothetical protein